MNKPNILKNWIVARNTDTSFEKRTYYGTLEELIEDYDGNWVEIPFENWLSEDIVEIFEIELEDANYHSWSWLPDSLQQVMIQNKIQENERFDIILRTYIGWVYS